MSDDYLPGPDWFDSMDRAMERCARNMDDSIAKLKSDPCLDIPVVGDHVLIHPTAVGKGRDTFRLEAEVLRTASNAYEVRYLTYLDYHTKEPKVEWVDSFVVTDVLPKSTLISSGGDGTGNGEGGVMSDEMLLPTKVQIEIAELKELRAKAALGEALEVLITGMADEFARRVDSSLDRRIHATNELSAAMADQERFAWKIALSVVLAAKAAIEKGGV